MSEYAPVLCNKCFSDNHESCDGVARIEVNGDSFYGTCRCRCRNSFNKLARRSAKDPSSPTDTGQATVLPDPGMQK